MFHKFHIFTLCITLFFAKETISMHPMTDAEKAGALENTITKINNFRNDSLTTFDELSKEQYLDLQTIEILKKLSRSITEANKCLKILRAYQANPSSQELKDKSGEALSKTFSQFFVTTIALSRINR